MACRWAVLRLCCGNYNHCPPLQPIRTELRAALDAVQVLGGALAIALARRPTAATLGALGEAAEDAQHKMCALFIRGSCRAGARLVPLVFSLDGPCDVQ